MNRFVSLFTIVTVFFLSIFLQVGNNVSYAQGSYWSDISVRSDQGSPTIQPSVYRTVAIDIETIRQVLDSAPHEKEASARNSSAIIELPMPDGTMQLYKYELHFSNASDICIVSMRNLQPHCDNQKP